MFYSVTFAKTVLTQITGTSQKSPFCSQPNSGAAIKQMMSSTAFGKITAVYVPVGCLNYVHFDDMGRHMSVSIEHFFWTCSAFNEKRRMFTKSIAV